MTKELTQEDIDRINAKNAAGIAKEAMQYRQQTGNRMPGFSPEENTQLQKAYYPNPSGLYNEEVAKRPSTPQAGDFWDKIVSMVTPGNRPIKTENTMYAQKATSTPFPQQMQGQIDLSKKDPLETMSNYYNRMGYKTQPMR
jgi:hypothetical protein